jgi:hypothetical protein
MVQQAPLHWRRSQANRVAGMAESIRMSGTTSIVSEYEWFLTNAGKYNQFSLEKVGLPPFFDQILT